MTSDSMFLLKFAILIYLLFCFIEIQRVQWNDLACEYIVKGSIELIIVSVMKMYFTVGVQYLLFLEFGL